MVNSKGIPPPTNAGRFRFRNCSIFFGGSSNGTWKSILPETNIAVDCFEVFFAEGYVCVGESRDYFFFSGTNIYVYPIWVLLNIIFRFPFLCLWKVEVIIFYG